MEITKLSSQGQVTIPQILRDQYHWEAGQELIIINWGDGILLKPKKIFPETTLDEVAGCLKYQGKAKTIEEMDQAIAQGIEELWNQCLEFYTFDQKFIKKSQSLSISTVKHPDL
jgi:AbrB family looped-hinge helix DNA binding protein